MPQISPPRVGIIATSLSSGSRSQLLAREALQRITATGVSAELIDLREYVLPLAGSDAGWSDPAAARLQPRVAAMTHLLFAVPIYNYDVNAAAKNFVELMGSDGLEDKTVAFLCSAGGKSSYMSVMAFANSLMLDFRCWVVPRFLYVTEDFVPGHLDADLGQRLDSLCHDLINGPRQRG